MRSLNNELPMSYELTFRFVFNYSHSDLIGSYITSARAEWGSGGGDKELQSCCNTIKTARQMMSLIEIRAQLHSEHTVYVTKRIGCGLKTKTSYYLLFLKWVRSG